ncbi:MAG: deoxyribonuclease IV [Planctomycetia bacterium]
MPILGAHMSISGGCHKAVERAAEVGCDCVQLFSKNNNQWRAKPLAEKDAQLFAEALETHGIAHPIIHDSYLINLASPDDTLWKKSIDAFIEELQRADLLGVPYVVTHPGSYTTSDEASGIARVVEALDIIHQQTEDLAAMCLLETTAGQGTNLGHTFEQLAAMLDGVAEPDRLGVCLDTCHIFAAGYPLIEHEEYLATFEHFDKVIGLDRLKAFHLNDSLRDFDSHVDRHAHIGHGSLGIEPFRHLMNDRRFHKIPMYLETPKGEENGQNWDVVNLSVLRGLVKK